MTSQIERPRVLVLGGTGFVGRNFVKYLVDSELCSMIRVADKKLPALGFFNQLHQAAFKSNIVKFVQADLSKEDHVIKAFKCDDGPFMYVFNLCGETRFGLPDAEYKKNIVKTAEHIGKVAMESAVEKFVEMSTASVYQSTKDPAKETSSIEPWTKRAAFRLKAEQKLAEFSELPLVILRPVFIYGLGDLVSLTPRLSTAAVYQFLGEKMKCLWTKDLRVNCVHVDDVCNALWTAATKVPKGTTLNLADRSDLDQGKLNAMLTELFGIKTGFYGTIISNLAKIHFESTVATANDKHVPGWQKLCEKYDILNTPISPFLDSALLRNNHLSVDGSHICSVTDFEYKHPVITTELLRQQVEEFIAAKLFPPVLV